MRRGTPDNSPFDPRAAKWEGGVLRFTVTKSVSPEIGSVAASVPSGDINVKQQPQSFTDQHGPNQEDTDPQISIKLAIPAWTRRGAERKTARLNKKAKVELTDEGVIIDQQVGQLRHPVIEAATSGLRAVGKTVFRMSLDQAAASPKLDVDLRLPDRRPEDPHTITRDHFEILYKLDTDTGNVTTENIKFGNKNIWENSLVSSRTGEIDISSYDTGVHSIYDSSGYLTIRNGEGSVRIDGFSGSLTVETSGDVTGSRISGVRSLRGGPYAYIASEEGVIDLTDVDTTLYVKGATRRVDNKGTTNRVLKSGYIGNVT